MARLANYIEALDLNFNIIHAKSALPTSSTRIEPLSFLVDLSYVNLRGS